ncbi:MAG TPA: C25 family cysteine peptidase, partial [Candidatus Krumholzibacteriaceae bacterium]
MGRILSALIALMICIALAASGLSASTLSWKFTLDPSQLTYRETAPGQLQIRIDGYSSLEYFDYPSLPYRVVSFLVPQGEDVSSCRLDVLGEAAVTPAKPVGLYRGSSRVDGTTAGVTIAKAEAESENGLFPKWQVRYLGSNFYRGYRIANVAVYPLRYNVKSGGIILDKEIRLVVETAPALSQGDAAERVRAIPGFREESRRNLARMVINPEAAATYSFNEIKVDPGTKAYAPTYEPSMQGSDVSYLIVTNEAMAPAFQRLADSKTKKGIPSVVRTVEWIAQNSRSGADVAESVRNYIRDAYAKWGVEWVLIGG